MIFWENQDFFKSRFFSRSNLSNLWFNSNHFWKSFQIFDLLAQIIFLTQSFLRSRFFFCDLLKSFLKKDFTIDFVTLIKRSRNWKLKFRVKTAQLKGEIPLEQFLSNRLSLFLSFHLSPVDISSIFVHLMSIKHNSISLSCYSNSKFCCEISHVFIASYGRNGAITHTAKKKQ